MNFYSLFLKTQALFNVSKITTQDSFLMTAIVIGSLSCAAEKWLKEIAELTLDEVVSAVMESNVLFTPTSHSAELSSSKKHLYWAQLSKCNASRVSFGTNWTYHHVCSHPRSCLKAQTFLTSLLNQKLSLVSMCHAAVDDIFLKLRYFQKGISPYLYSYILMN